MPFPSTDALQAALPNAVLAFRGYNVTNLGRTPELLEDSRYSATLVEHLRQADACYYDVTGRRCDLVERVRRREETNLESYAAALALIVAVEMAQLQMLSQVHGIDYRHARFSMGYSLGEITAVVAGGVTDWRSALRVPMALADDCASLAARVTLAIVFSRARSIPLDALQQLCIEINREGQGVIAVSAFLSPNTVLLMGQDDTVDRFKTLAGAWETPLIVRKNPDQWPPLHTPIVWEKHIPSRAGLMMHTLPDGTTAPRPPILSLVTGGLDYTAVNARSMLQQWTDHPQRLWNVVYEVLARGVKLVLHVGPQPNIIPSTFQRLADNVQAQTRSQLRVRALAAAARRPWLAGLLPQRTALLRAPDVRHVVLEDWLLSERCSGP